MKCKDSVSYYWSNGPSSISKTPNDFEGPIRLSDSVSYIDDRYCFDKPKKLEISTISYAKALGYSCRLLKNELDILYTMNK